MSTGTSGGYLAASTGANKGVAVEARPRLELLRLVRVDLLLAARKERAEVGALHLALLDAIPSVLRVALAVLLARAAVEPEPLGSSRALSRQSRHVGAGASGCRARIRHRLGHPSVAHGTRASSRHVRHRRERPKRGSVPHPVRRGALVGSGACCCVAAVPSSDAASRSTSACPLCPQAGDVPLVLAPPRARLRQLFSGGRGPLPSAGGAGKSGRWRVAHLGSALLRMRLSAAAACAAAATRSRSAMAASRSRRRGCVQPPGSR